MTVAPLEAKAPLIVDPDAPLTDPVTQETFQAIAWNTPHVTQISGVIQHL
jgi:hypothetical protein